MPASDEGRDIMLMGCIQAAEGQSACCTCLLSSIDLYYERLYPLRKLHAVVGSTDTLNMHVIFSGIDPALVCLCQLTHARPAL